MPKPSAEFIAALVADPAKTECPACGERGFWDNRGSGKKGPAFKCKNKQCDTGGGFPFGVFARDLPASAQASTNGSPKVQVTWKQMAKAYDECVMLALHEGEKIGKTGIVMTGEHIAAMAATLMISRTNASCWPVAAAPAAPPPPPPPPPPPDSVSSGDDDLPF